jgi:acetylornithine/N-succinyldiaminopimelate aminotransferase
LGSLVALRVLDITTEKGFLDRVNRLGELFKEGLDKLQKKHHGFFKGTRQLGLMIGLELRDEVSGPILTKAAYDNDLLLVYANNDTRMVQLLPPLIIKESDVKFALKQLDKSFKRARILYAMVQIKDKLHRFLN